MAAEVAMPPVAPTMTAQTKETIAALWDETTRPKLVADTLKTLGAEKLLAKVGLDENVINGVATMTTIAGLKEKKTEFAEIAVPIVEKAYTADGRKEIVADLMATPLGQTTKAKVEEKIEAGKAFAGEKLEAGKAFVYPYVEVAKEKSAPYVESGKAYAAPYVASVKETTASLKEKTVAMKETVTAKVEATKESVITKVEATKETVKEKSATYVESGKAYAAPYVTTVKEKATPYVEKLEAIRRSERVEAMVAAFNEAREHPAEKVGELRAAAVDLIKYEKLREYREHIMSAEFQADTARLVQVDLPAIAKNAAEKGALTVKEKAKSLSVELEAFKVKVAKVVAEYSDKVSVSDLKEGLKRVPSSEDIEAMRKALHLKGSELYAELLPELTEGVDVLKASGLKGFSMADAMERLKRVGGILDKLVVTPLKEQVTTLLKPTAEEAAPTGAVKAEVAMAPADESTVAASLTIKDRPLPVNGSVTEESVAGTDDGEEMQDALEPAEDEDEDDEVKAA